MAETAVGPGVAAPSKLSPLEREVGSLGVPASRVGDTVVGLPLSSSTFSSLSLSKKAVGAAVDIATGTLVSDVVGATVGATSVLGLMEGLRVGVSTGSPSMLSVNVVGSAVGVAVGVVVGGLVGTVVGEPVGVFVNVMTEGPPITVCSGDSVNVWKTEAVGNAVCISARAMVGILVGDPETMVLPVSADVGRAVAVSSPTTFVRVVGDADGIVERATEGAEVFAVKPLGPNLKALLSPSSEVVIIPSSLVETGDGKGFISVGAELGVVVPCGVGSSLLGVAAGEGIAASLEGDVLHITDGDEVAI